MQSTIRNVTGQSYRSARELYKEAKKRFLKTVKAMFTWIDLDSVKGGLRDLTSEITYSKDEEKDLFFNVIGKIMNDITLLFKTDSTLAELIDKMRNNESVSGYEYSIVLGKISDIIIGVLERERVTLSPKLEYLIHELYDNIYFNILRYDKVTPYTVDFTINTGILKKILMLNNVRLSIVKDRLLVVHCCSDNYENGDEEEWILPHAFYEVPLESVKLPPGIRVSEVFTILDTDDPKTWYWEFLWKSLNERRTIRIQLMINPSVKNNVVKGRIGDITVYGEVGTSLVGRFLDFISRKSNTRYVLTMNTRILQYLYESGLEAVLFSNGRIAVSKNNIMSLILGPDTVFNDEPVFTRIEEARGKPEGIVIPPVHRLEGVYFELVDNAEVYTGGSLGVNFMKMHNPSNRVNAYFFFDKFNPKSYIGGKELLEEYVYRGEWAGSVYSHVYPLPAPNITPIEEWWNERPLRNPIPWLIIGRRGIAYFKDNPGSRFLLCPGEIGYYARRIEQGEKSNPSRNIIKAYTYFNARSRPASITLRVNDVPVTLTSQKESFPPVSIPFYNTSDGDVVVDKNVGKAEETFYFPDDILLLDKVSARVDWREVETPL